MDLWETFCTRCLSPDICFVIRWVLCANHTEPVKGFLGRHLRRKLIETEIGSRTRNTELVKIIDWIPRVWHHLNRFLETHSSSDVTIGKKTVKDLLLLVSLETTTGLPVCSVAGRTSSLSVMSHGRGGIQGLVH